MKDSEQDHDHEYDCVECSAVCVRDKAILGISETSQRTNDIKVLQEAREILSGMLKESLTRSKGGLLHEESADPVKSKL